MPRLRPVGKTAAKIRVKSVNCKYYFSQSRYFMDGVGIAGTAVPNRLGTAVPDAGNHIPKHRESPSRPLEGCSSVQFNMSGL